MTGDGRQPRPQRSASKSSGGSRADSTSKNAAASSEATVENGSSVSASNGMTQGSTSKPMTMADIDPKILNTIRQCIREETAELKADIKMLKGKLESIDKLSQSITSLTTTITTVENGLQFASHRLDHMGEKVIPAIDRHMSSLSQRLLHETRKPAFSKCPR